MKQYTRKDLMKKWFDFYTSKNHVIIPSASVIPENDPSVLFTTAGMHPLVPYLLGQPHPKGKRLCDVQKCIRTGDIDEVGDNSHCTFFEMLGNWSLGDYFKKEMISWSYEFLTSPDYLGIDPNKLAVTVFAGNENVPEDKESAKYWEEAGIKRENIYFLKDNWWILGSGVGPCGSDTEMFIDSGKPKCSPECNPSCDCGKFMEIWNDVFMEFRTNEDKTVTKLSQHNVDTGMGLERVLCKLNNVESVFDTEIFAPVIKRLEELSGKDYRDSQYTASFRIIADHLRTSTMIIGDEQGIAPSNIGQGYVLRRLIRRAIRHMRKLEIEAGFLGEIANIYVEYFKEDYPELKQNQEKIVEELNKEEQKFLKTLELGNKEFDKVVNGMMRKNEFMKDKDGFIPETQINGKSAFRLYDTFGFPIELTVEMAKERGLSVDIEGFNEAFKAHQELARSTSAGAFKGGLADDSVWTTRLHTACHLLLAGLRKMFGTHIEQKGSNITSERLRFDFNFDRKLDENEVKELEKFVNDAIAKNIDIERVEMSFKDAKNCGGYGIHKADENETVSIYKIGDLDFQICGGPHAKNTSELVNFRIAKQEAVSAGVRRIKAVINF
ncbi:MAG: alanine--tRNA ligase [Clostridiales bacterium]|nr:alanine--tRNA ligase [Clostridiales bacterium]